MPVLLSDLVRAIGLLNIPLKIFHSHTKKLIGIFLHISAEVDFGKQFFYQQEDSITRNRGRYPS